MTDPLDMDMSSLMGEGRETTPPGSIARALTEEDLEQKTWITIDNRNAIFMVLSFNAYLEKYIGQRSTLLDAMIENAVIYNKSVDGQNIGSIINLASSIHQQPSSNINIGESFSKKMGGA